MHAVFIYFFIYIGTFFYTLAAYLHLNLTNWTFMRALALALPLVILEYMFSLRGNHFADTVLGLDPLQILTVTIGFYFINLWIVNHFVLKRPVNLFRDLVAFALIIAAFWTSTGFN
jgi:uncharacterized protein (DUF486 family)